MAFCAWMILLATLPAIELAKEGIVRLLEGFCLNLPGPKTLQWLVLLSSLTLASAGALIPLAMSGGLHRGHLRHLHRFPPTWMAAVLVILTISVYPPRTIDSPDWAFSCLGSLVILTVAAALAMLVVVSPWTQFHGWLERTASRKEPSREPVHPQQTLTDDPETILAWLNTDDAVTKPADDRFGADRLALHLAEVLQSGAARRVGLLGPWGAGKTTVLTLVEHYIGEHHSGKNEPRIISCRVNAWGFLKDSAPALVLRTALIELKKHVDCLALQNVPARYSQAAKAIGGNLVEAALSMVSAPDPVEQLRRMAVPLEAINARLLIIVEDVDRNQLSGTPPAHLELESLLDDMRDVPRLSFVISLSLGER